jgi:DNA-binding response OmpR family regulator
MAKILLVEDDNSLRTAYEMILTRKNHRVETAINGQEALSKLKGFTPQIVLLDLLMPVMGGLEFLKKYRPKDNPEVAVLLLTNMPSSPEVEQCLKLGVKSTAVKSSMTPGALIDLVEDTLRG